MNFSKSRQNNGLSFILFWSLLNLLLIGCLKDKTIPYQSNTINLKWHKSYPDDSFKKAVEGLNWGLSHVGAGFTIGESNLNQLEEKVGIDPSELGMSTVGKATLIQLHEKIQRSDLYQINGWLDMGQYLTLLIGSSEHYYKLTGVPETLNEWRNQYEIAPIYGFVSNSEISYKPRELYFYEPNGLEQFFLSKEFDTISDETLGFEAFDVMSNGQLRYGVFDANGNRMAGANAAFSDAGKPGKCMWCHESAIQPLFGVQEARPGYLSPDDLADTLWHFRLRHKDTQTSLSDGVDFTNLAGHVHMELLYISYLEPSIEQLAAEWGQSVEEVSELLAALETHNHEEFPFLGERYWRDEVNLFSPVPLLPTPTDVRELDGEEVNLLE
jgi:hypothetical protein